MGRTYRRWQELTAAQALVAETLEQFERERQPAVFANASERLGFFTQGRYVQIRQDPDGQGFSVLDSDLNPIAPIDLSRGTREQLYLAVRLGLIEEFMGRGTALPLVMDEILVNFDPERMAAVARELGRFAEDRQILLFTCHPELGDRMARLSSSQRPSHLSRAANRTTSRIIRVVSTALRTRAALMILMTKFHFETEYL